MEEKTVFYRGIYLDYSKDELIDEFGKKTLLDRYMLPDEKSPQESFARAAIEYSDDLDMAQRIYDYASNQWFMFSTPILSNGGTKKGASISCFLNNVPDSREGLSDHYDENIWLASNGGGIGGSWNDVRSESSKTSNGSKSSGVIPFLHVVDSQMLAFSQGSTRRGSYAAYLDINHPEIEEFLSVRKPTGGDTNRKSLNIHNAVNITDQFMEIIEKCMYDKDFKDDWDLIDPNTKSVIKTVSAKELWQSILELRIQTGEPYLHFIDRSNENMPETQKKLGLKINGSNLCLTGDTLISIKSIKYNLSTKIELKEVDKYMEMYSDLEVLTYNINTKKEEYKKIKDFALTKKNAKLIKITDKETGKSIKCTPEHEIFTENRGYVMAKNLCKDDKLIIE